LQSPEQKTWFLSALPSSFRLHESEQVGDGWGDTRSTKQTATLKPETLKLRVVRSMSWNYRQGESGFMGFGHSETPPRQPGERFWEHSYTTEEAAENQQTYRDRISKIVIFSEPNRYVPGALPLNKPPLFGKTVSLAGAKTVGELVMRIADKTGIELYADRRVSALSVTLGGSSDARADCADLIKALCLATTGTVRGVGEKGDETVYLLTGNQKGDAATRLSLSEWASDVEALLQAEQTALQTVAKKGDYVANVGFDPQSPTSLSSDLMRTIEKNIRNPQPTSENHGYQTIPVSALPPAGQEQVRRDLERHAQWQTNGVSPLDAKTVYASFYVQTQIVAEGYGVFSGSSLSSLGSLLEKQPAKRPAPNTGTVTGAVALPPVLTKFAALQIGPTTSEEARDAARWARSRGFAALFVPVSLWDDAAVSRFGAVVEGAKGAGVAVYPVVSLFRVSGDDAKVCADLSRTRNVSGETLLQYGKRRMDAPAVRLDDYTRSQVAPLLAGDWLDAFDNAVQDAAAKRLSAVAGTPGIGGVVLADVAAPGLQSASPEWTNGATGARSGGYTLANRLAFIRQENIDPLDLLPNGNLQPYLDWSDVSETHEPPPFYTANHQVEGLLQTATAYRRGADGVWNAATPKPDNRERSPWNAMLFERNREVVARVRKAANLPDTLHVFAMIVPEGYSSPRPVPWDAETLPPAKLGDDSLYPFSLRRATTVDTVRGNALRVSDWARQQKTFPYGGTMIDATANPVAESLRLLSAIAPTGAKP
ncbi:MAG: hypothetical protein H7Y38_20520, partial [Armatimonadetes bacterium]|nr:hypothetical protein [Armatimonadota bacterium]